MVSGLADVLPLIKQHDAASGRQIVLVDIENVVGGAVLTQSSAAWARRRIEAVLAPRPDAQIVIGTSHASFIETALAWPHKQYVVNSGPDGADIALLREIESLRVDRYDEVVLVSGDGIFADAVAALAGHVREVTVVAHSGQCARRLQLAATRTIYLQSSYNHSNSGDAA